jgi:hypothetical protein
MTGDTLDRDTRFVQLAILGEPLGNVLRVTCVDCSSHAQEEGLV